VGQRRIPVFLMDGTGWGSWYPRSENPDLGHPYLLLMGPGPPASIRIPRAIYERVTSRMAVNSGRPQFCVARKSVV
jgi:hypothetical protein